MANIKTLYGSDKLREAYPKVNENFNAVNREVSDLRVRVNNIITTPIDDKAAAQELVDARDGESSLGERLERDLQVVESHLAESVQQGGGVHGLIVEKGTWTPALNPNQNVELDIQTGSYVRIGDIVHCFMDIQISNMGSWSGTQIAYISGLPFIAKNSAPHSVAEFSKVNLPQNGVDMFLVLEGSNIYLRSNWGSLNYSAVSYVASHFGVGSRIRTSFSYQI